MLVLQRTNQEKIFIGTKDNPKMIEIVLVSTRGNTAKIGINAPKEYTILREELYKENSDDSSS